MEKKNISLWSLFRADPRVWFLVIPALVALCWAVLWVGENYIQPEACYSRAMEAEMAGEWGTAYGYYREIQDFNDSAGRMLNCRYREACSHMEAGEYETARDIFEEMGDYKDCRILLGNCTYLLAKEKLGQAQSVKTDGSALDVLDTSAMSGVLEELSMLPVDDTTYPLYRDIMPENRIAAGEHHVVVLLRDGTVRAYGDNAYGQCDVDGWTEIIAVAAGTRHTVGLRADGTVVAAGDNSANQCSVLGWSGIKGISASVTDTVAVSEDGRVYHTGYSAYSTDDFEKAVYAAAGQTGAIAVTASGTTLTAGCTGGNPEETAVRRAVLMRNNAYVLLENGTITGPGFDGAEYAVSITACSVRVLAVFADGSVRQYVSAEGKMLELSGWENAAEAVSASGYAVCLHRDGTISLAGDYPPGAEALLGINLFE